MNNVIELKEYQNKKAKDYSMNEGTLLQFPKKEILETKNHEFYEMMKDDEIWNGLLLIN